MRPRKSIAVATLLAAALAAFAIVRPEPGPRARGRFEQSVYVWQRSWTRAVRDAVDAHAHSFAETVVLGGEIEWRDGAPRVTYVDPPLAPTRRRVGLALRIGRSPRPPGTDARDRALVADTAAS